MFAEQEREFREAHGSPGTLESGSALTSSAAPGAAGLAALKLKPSGIGVGEVCA